MSNTILFIGATGGVTNACLTAVLESNEYKVIAMVRNPEKLKTQLQTLQGLEESLINERLTIVKGNATDATDVKSALLTNVTTGVDQTLPHTIVTGVGGSPILTFSIWQPLTLFKIDQPNLCGDAAKTLVSALQSIYADKPALAGSRPAVTFISTTGITKGPEDVPFSMRWLYHQVLAEPHVDKKIMEETFRNELVSTSPAFSQVTGIRPTLLMGSGALKESSGIEKIRAGVESKPELGFTVQRADVGVFVFEKIVKGADEGKWRGEMVSLTA